MTPTEPNRWRGSRPGPWWRVWAALCGSLAGLLLVSLPAIEWPLAALAGVAVMLWAWAQRCDSHDKYVAVTMPEEEPRVRVRAGDERGEGW